MWQDELEKLNSIVWPAIRQLAQKEIAYAANNGNKLLTFYVYNFLMLPKCECYCGCYIN